MANEQKLFFREAGTREGKGSIVFLHGAFGSGGDFARIVPGLEQDYHLILPDMPRHGKSQHITPYSTTLAAQLVADIVRAHGQGGRAHVIGFSMGMSIAMELITKHPEVVDEVFMSGYKRLPYSKYLGHGFWLSQKMEGLMPQALKMWLLDGTQFPEPSGTPCTLSLCQEIVSGGSLNSWPPPWPAKSLIISAGKAGILPTADDAEAAIKLRDIARTLNPQTKAYTHPLMRHPWPWQDPDLYTRSIRMWFEKGEVPEGFVEL